MVTFMKSLKGQPLLCCCPILAVLSMGRNNWDNCPFSVVPPTILLIEAFSGVTAGLISKIFDEAVQCAAFILRFGFAADAFPLVST